ncbi:MAG: ParB/RepB/Spo0J family partition protein [Alphaproteobacteria bacterium]|nr:ParB/RepB/Spo0J family partition protein [Alphaproteobacteria bacterium]
MSADAKKRGLGRGLDALFRDARAEETDFIPATRRAEEVAEKIVATAAPQSQRRLPVDKLTPGKYQPRRRFDDAGLDQLAESIGVHGVLQPLLVRPIANGMHEIIAGERRWRAAQKAQVHDVPVVVQDLSDQDALEIGLIENLQREDLSPIEEAEGYTRLMQEFGHTQEMLASHLSKSRSHVANMMRLLKLPPPVRKLVETGVLSAGHGRALIGVSNAEEVAGVIIRRGLNVRQVEKLVQKTQTSSFSGKTSVKTGKKPKYVEKDVDTLALEEKMTALLGLPVTIDGKGAKGKLVIEYANLEQLDDVLERLSRAPQR